MKYIPLALAVLALAAAGCESSTGSSNSDSADGKYDQTWSQSYAATSCLQWQRQMNSQQQWVAAADMLSGARNNGDGGSGLPPDALISQFQSAISGSCSVVPNWNIAEVAAGEYLTSRAQWRP